MESKSRGTRPKSSSASKAKTVPIQDSFRTLCSTGCYREQLPPSSPLVKTLFVFSNQMPGCGPPGRLPPRPRARSTIRPRPFPHPIRATPRFVSQNKKTINKHRSGYPQVYPYSNTDIVYFGVWLSFIQASTERPCIWSSKQTVVWETAFHYVGKPTAVEAHNRFSPVDGLR